MRELSADTSLQENAHAQIAEKKLIWKRKHVRSAKRSWTRKNLKRSRVLLLNSASKKDYNNSIKEGDIMLTDKEIKTLGKSVLHPFSEDHVGPVSYDLDIEGYIDATGNLVKQDVALIPQETIIVKTIQSLNVPDDIVGIIGERNSRIRQGLQVSGPHYFPGHDTAIYLRITNVSPSKITLKTGEGIAQIFFERLSTVPEKTYDRVASASFNNENSYLGYGKYKSEYLSQMEEIKKAEKKLENTEHMMYANILTLMGIFVAIVSVLLANLSNVAILTVGELLKVNLSLAFVITLMLGLVLLFLNSKDKNKKLQKGFVTLMVVATVALLVALIFA